MTYINIKYIIFFYLFIGTCGGIYIVSVALFCDENGDIASLFLFFDLKSFKQFSLVSWVGFLVSWVMFSVSWVGFSVSCIWVFRQLTLCFRQFIINFLSMTHLFLSVDHWLLVSWPYCSCHLIQYFLSVVSCILSLVSWLVIWPLHTKVWIISNNRVECELFFLCLIIRLF